MKLNFASSDCLAMNDTKFSTSSNTRQNLHTLTNRSCTCWRGNSRAVIACQVCQLWSKALGRLEEK